MKKIKLAMLLLVCGTILAGVAKDKFLDTPSAVLKKIYPGPVFGESGSSFVFDIYYASLLPFGTLTFSTRTQGNKTVYSVEATPVGGILGRRIDAAARLEAFMSQEGWSEQYLETTRYRQKTKTKTIDFDRQALVAARGNKKIKIPTDTFDPLGGFMSLLALPLGTNPQSIKCLAEDVIYEMRATVIDSHEGISHILVEIQRGDGSPGHRASFHVWINDKTRLPLVFKSWTPAGYASVILKSAKP